MPLIKEFLNGGVVTARDPSLLQPSELQQADDCILRPNTPALYKAPGRTSFGVVTAATKIKGLAHLAFDGNPDAIVAYAGTKLRSAPYTSDNSGVGTFADLVTGLPNAGTETMDVVQYKGVHYLALGGSARIRRVAYNIPITNVTPTLSSRVAGMVPVVGPQGSGATAGSSLTVTTVTGAWPETVGGNGFYWFLVTEVISPDSPDEVESTYVGDPVYGEIVDHTLQTFQIYRRADHSTTLAFNDGTNDTNVATYWRIYMSSRQPDINTIPTLGTFQAVRTVPLAQASVTFGSYNTITQYHAPTAQTTDPNGLQAFVNPANVVGATYSTNTYDNVYAASGNYVNGPSGIVLRNFGFGSSAGVTGIRVQTKGYYFNLGAPGSFTIRLYKNNGASGTGVGSKTFELGRINSNISFLDERGGADDLWGATWAAGDFVDGTFAIEIIVQVGAGYLFLDGVVVQLFQGNSLVDQTGNYFQVVNVDAGVGVITTFGANGCPPYASTADIFQGQLVCNEVTHPTTIHYSLTDQPEYFPEPYVLSFESKAKDEVNFLRTVNNILVVGLTNGLKRVNWLPREQDAEFNGGRAWEDITTTHGIAGPHCGTIFEFENSGPLLAYVSQNGLWMTDGMTTRLLNQDLDWTNLINTTYASSVVLKNYPKLYLLAMYYTPVGGATSNTKCLYFSYHPMHIKEGNHLPAVGPVTVSAASAAEAVLLGQHRLLTGHNSDGTVYVEDSGISDGSGGTIVPTIALREMFLAGEGYEARVDRLYVHHQAYGDITTGVCSAALKKHNIGEAVTTLETINFNTTLRGLSVIHIDNIAECHTLALSKANLAAGMAIDFVAFSAHSGGTEEHYA